MLSSFLCCIAIEGLSAIFMSAICVTELADRGVKKPSKRVLAALVHDLPDGDDDDVFLGFVDRRWKPHWHEYT